MSLLKGFVNGVARAGVSNAEGHIEEARKKRLADYQEGINVRDREDRQQHEFDLLARQTQDAKDLAKTKGPDGEWSLEFTDPSIDANGNTIPGRAYMIHSGSGELRNVDGETDSFTSFSSADDRWLAYAGRLNNNEGFDASKDYQAKQLFLNGDAEGLNKYLNDKYAATESEQQPAIGSAAPKEEKKPFDFSGSKVQVNQELIDSAKSFIASAPTKIPMKETGGFAGVSVDTSHPDYQRYQKAEELRELLEQYQKGSANTYSDPVSSEAQAGRIQRIEQKIAQLTQGGEPQQVAQPKQPGGLLKPPSNEIPAAEMQEIDRAKAAQSPDLPAVDLTQLPPNVRKEAERVIAEGKAQNYSDKQINEMLYQILSRAGLVA